MTARGSVASAIELQDIELVEIQPKSSGPLGASSSHAGRILGRSPSASSNPSFAEAPVIVAASAPKLSTFRAWVLLLQLCGNNFIPSIGAGMLMVCLPTIAADLKLSPNLLLWPTAVSALASASFQLIAGSISDTIGPRRINTLGSLLQPVFIVATGLSKDGTQLIIFRTLLGVASSMFSSSARSMLSTNIAHGRLRNFAISAMVLAFPMGAGIGLFLGGVYAETSWRIGYWSSGAIGLLLSLSSLWTLPADPEKDRSRQAVIRRLKTEVDWIGALMGSLCAGLLSYVLALLSANTDHIREPTTIALLAISLALMPGFAFWMHYQTKKQRPALIPNALWKEAAFTSVCVMIALSNGTQTSLTLFVSFFFQEIQGLTALEASVRLLPQAIVGCLMCLFVGLFVNKVTPVISVLSTMIVASIAPLLMAITNPAWPYWYTAFWAQAVAPLSIDVMFVVGFLVVSDAFSGSSQARASAVFSTFAQLGSSIGLCVMSVISNSVIDSGVTTDKLLTGYRASFWTQFAWISLAWVIGAFGLRRLREVGAKRD